MFQSAGNPPCARPPVAQSGATEGSSSIRNLSRSRPPKSTARCAMNWPTFSLSTAPEEAGSMPMAQNGERPAPISESPTNHVATTSRSNAATWRGNFSSRVRHARPCSRGCVASAAPWPASNAVANTTPENITRIFGFARSNLPAKSPHKTLVGIFQRGTQFLMASPCLGAGVTGHSKVSNSQEAEGGGIGPAGTRCHNERSPSASGRDCGKNGKNGWTPLFQPKSGRRMNRGLHR